MIDGHTCITDDGGTPNRKCEACEFEKDHLGVTIEKDPTFPLTADEAKLLYDELETHTFSKHHPMYHYHSGLLSRMRSFIENNQDKLRICGRT